jgi:hypothetical protein
MTQANRVHSTPPTNTPIDTTRRHFLAVAAGASVASVGTLAVAAMPTAAPDSPACAVDPAFAVIAEKQAADVAHEKACDALSDAEERYRFHSDAAEEAWENSGAACHAADQVGWKLAATLPTTLAGVAAVLRFANEIEDAGGEWPDTDTIGPDGWHYQLRATMAAAIEEALIKARAGKAVQS